MKIILLDDVTKVGRRGDVKDVSDGFARELPHPQEARPERHRRQSQESRPHPAPAGRQGRAHQGRRRGPARAHRGVAYEERRQASEEGKLFGSVTAQDIADFLGRQGVTMERRRIQLDEPIKSLGATAVPFASIPR